MEREATGVCVCHTQPHSLVHPPGRAPSLTNDHTLQVPDTEEFSYDGVHWGPEMNLVKAAFLLTRIFSGD